MLIGIVNVVICYSLQWNDGSGRGAIGVEHVDDLGFISAMIDFLEARYAADPARKND